MPAKKMKKQELCGMIDADLDLYIDRGPLGLVRMTCKYSEGADAKDCSMFCPHFSEPQHDVQGGPAIIEICDGKILVFAEFTDGRKNAK